MSTIRALLAASALCALVTACYAPSPDLREKAGDPPKGTNHLRAEATGFFISPTLILTNRHLYNENFLGFRCQTVRAASADGSLKAADLELVALPVRDTVDLALLRLKSGAYPAAPVTLHHFDQMPDRIAEPNARLLTYPYFRAVSDKVDMTPVAVDLYLLDSLAVDKTDNEDVLLSFGPDGHITRPTPPGSPRSPLDPTKTHHDLLMLAETLYPGASGSPVLDRTGRVIGVIKEKADLPEDDVAKIGMAVDETDIAKFLRAHNVPITEDPSPEETAPQQPDMTRNVVRLFCF